MSLPFGRAPRLVIDPRDGSSQEPIAYFRTSDFDQDFKETLTAMEHDGILPALMWVVICEDHVAMAAASRLTYPNVILVVDDMPWSFGVIRRRRNARMERTGRDTTPQR
jgi:hypothetical protein